MGYVASEKLNSTVKHDERCVRGNRGCRKAHTCSGSRARKGVEDGKGEQRWAREVEQNHALRVCSEARAREWRFWELKTTQNSWSVGYGVGRKVGNTVENFVTVKRSFNFH